MKKVAKRTIEIIGGVLLIVAGIVLWLLPVFPGAFLVIPGVFLISPHHGRKMLVKIKEWEKKYISPYLKRFKRKK